MNEPTSTYSALEDAIRAHVAEQYENGCVVTDWYVIAAAARIDGGSTQYTHVNSDAPYHSLHGLVDIAHRRLLAGIDRDEEV